MAGVVLAVALLLAVAPCHGLFGWGNDEEEAAVTLTITSYNTITVRTAYAMQFLQNSSVLQAVPSLVVPIGGGEVTVYHALPAEAVLVFTDPTMTSDDQSWSTNTREVPFLQPFVYTSQAPSVLLDAWEPMSNGANTTGELADAVADLVGPQEVLRVICVGQGPAGGLAVLCGPWAALQFPKANVDVVTFNTPWSGFNPQFAWSFEQLVVLHYMWPFDAPPATGGVLAAAEAVNPLISTFTLTNAVRLPNLPTFAPADLQEPGDRSFDEIFAALGPNTTLPAEYQMPESDCPVMFCKTLPLLNASCLGFDNDTLLASIPHKVLKDNKTNADAVAAWDEATQTAFFLFKYTEEKRDWLIDANSVQVGGFVESCEALVPGSEEALSLTTLVGDVQIHAGFLKQFESLAISPQSEAENITAALYSLSGGKKPRRVACSGFSLGAALSELCGMWASILWPGADILVANQGGPMPGNEDWVLLFEATVGRAYKYVYRMDLVPSVAPFEWYKRVPASIWINGTTALLQDRPYWSVLDESWNDHTCDTWLNPENNETIIGYVPRLEVIKRPSIPNWVYNATAAETTA